MNDLHTTLLPLHIDRAKQRAPDAWAVIYRDLAPRLQGYLRSMQFADAEDIVSDVFVSMVRSIDSFDGGVDELRAWAYAIARNAGATAVRSEQRHARRVDAALEHLTESDHLSPGVDTAVTDADRVTTLLATLTNRQREVMVLRVVSDLTVQQVAWVMGEPVPTIKALQRRAVRQLQELLENEGEHP